MPVDPRVLVVVPAFNAETTILETLQTILASTVPLRCVVVDPSSTDATPSLVAELARNDARLTYATFARERISAGLRRRDAHALGGGLRNLAICGYLAGWALVWLVVPNAVRVRRFAGGIDRGLRRS